MAECELIAIRYQTAPAWRVMTIIQTPCLQTNGRRTYKLTNEQDSKVHITNGCPLTIICHTYCKTVYFRCISISRCWNVEILLHFDLAFSQCSTSIYQSLMGKLNFRGYLISQFYPTREICENLMHAKNMFYSMTICALFLLELVSGAISN